MTPAGPADVPSESRPAETSPRGAIHDASYANRRQNGLCRNGFCKNDRSRGVSRTTVPTPARCWLRWRTAARPRCAATPSIRSPAARCASRSTTISIASIAPTAYCIRCAALAAKAAANSNVSVGTRRSTRSAGRYQAIIAEYGAQAILPYSYLGTEGLLNGLNVGDAFFNRLGASISERTFCASGAITGYMMTVGPDAGHRPRESRPLPLHHHLGLQRNQHQPSSMADYRRGQAPRREGGGDRSDA